MGSKQGPPTTKREEEPMSYQGPDKDFGEHDDYEIGDVVHTYDNEVATVIGVIPNPMDTSPWSTVYEVTNERGAKRYFDGSRLALIRRAPMSVEPMNMTLDDFVEMVTDKTGFVISDAKLDDANHVTITFETDDWVRANG